MKHTYRHLRIPFLLFTGIICIVSFLLMFRTFSYDTHTLHIATKAWSDFGAHIPLIRSFSKGANLSRFLSGRAVQSPLYPGEPIRYHYGFYAVVGILEKLGVPIDWALNIPSALGLTLLVCSIALLSFILFRNPWVSALSVLVFFCNGSLSFLRFFRDHPLSLRTPIDILTNQQFTSFGPWDGGDITAFWTLNIYTNQRHLALSYGLILFAIIVLIHPPATLKKHPVMMRISLAGIATLLMFFNFPALAIFGLLCLSVFLYIPERRRSLVIAGLLTIPPLLFLSKTAELGSPIAWQPGYLAASADIRTIVQFWIDNIGLHVILIPLGILLAPKRIRRLFAAPILILFILPNLYRFSPDMINNHKFFNFVLIIGGMFSSYAVVRIMQGKSSRAFPRTARALVGCILIILLTLSGVIDLFPVLNDTVGDVSDAPTNADTAFFLTHTPTDAIIANSTWFYHPASLAGRSLFSGYTYFTWSYGYNQTKREHVLIGIYQAPDTSSLCRLLHESNIWAIELNDHPESYLSPNWTLWDSLTPEYQNPDTGRRIYMTAAICPQISNSR